MGPSTSISYWARLISRMGTQRIWSSSQSAGFGLGSNWLKGMSAIALSGDDGLSGACLGLIVAERLTSKPGGPPRKEGGNDRDDQGCGGHLRSLRESAIREQELAPVGRISGAPSGSHG